MESSSTKGNIRHGKLKSQKELKRITDSEEYKKSDYEGKTKKLNVATANKGMSVAQAKLAAKAPPPNKIDAKDFAVLRAEKAKGRGMGLQDESIKPGKVMKARVGRSVTRIPLAGKATSVGSTTMKGMKFSDKAKMVDAGKINKATGKFTSMEALRESVGYRPGESTSEFKKRRMALAAAKKTASASRIGKIALGIGAAGVAASQYLKSKMNKKKDVKKKMGGGMMMQRPMGYKDGTKPGAGPLGAAGRAAGLGALGVAGRPKKQQTPRPSAGRLASQEQKKRNSDDLVVIFSTKDGTKQIKRSDLDNMSAPEKKMGGGMMKKYSEGMSYKDMAPYGGKYAKIKKDMRDTASENVKRLTTQSDAYDPETRYVTAEQRKGNSRRRKVKKTTDQVYLKGVANKMKEDMGSNTRTSILTPSQARERRIIRPKRMAGRMGGGMMQKPMGYRTGIMVKARGCKLGRTKPTKIT